jgi:hypothetical protein
MLFAPCFIALARSSKLTTEFANPIVNLVVRTSDQSCSVLVGALSPINCTLSCKVLSTAENKLETT